MLIYTSDGAQTGD
jgi:hypothetical protein